MLKHIHDCKKNIRRKKKVRFILILIIVQIFENEQKIQYAKCKCELTFILGRLKLKEFVI